MGLSKYAKSTPLLEAMGIPRITELYFLFKIYFLKQIRSNGMADSVFKELSKTGLRHCRLGKSYFGQIADVSGFLGMDCLTVQESTACELIKARFSCHDYGLTEQINYVFNTWEVDKDSRILLHSLLRVNRIDDDEFEPDGGMTDSAYVALQNYLLELGG